MSKITEAQKKALGILKDTSWNKCISARGFADKMWGDTGSDMFLSSKNQGNGATRGKAAWLCAGSYLGRLRKKGWVNVEYYPDNPNGYYITEEGKKQLTLINPNT